MTIVSEQERRFYSSLPTKRIAAGALIFDEKNRLLILKPGYKDGWTIPGGIVNEDESPVAGCRREIFEETGLNIPDLELKCIDYMPNTRSLGDSLQFIFKAQKVLDSERAFIKICEKEIVDFRFEHVPEACEMLTSNLRKRVYEAIKLGDTLGVIYLESGISVL